MQTPIEYVYLFLACLTGSCILSMIVWRILLASETPRREFAEPEDDARILPPSPKVARGIEADEAELGNAYRD
jgi:energy-converting hydrogenase Eha subunit A